MPTTGAPHNLPWPPSTGVTPDVPRDMQALAAKTAERLGFAGKSIVATAEARTNTAYGLLATPDRVQNVVVPEGGLLAIWYQALWNCSSDAGNGRAAIFIGSNQLKVGDVNSAPKTQAALSFGEGLYSNLHSAPFGLLGYQNTTTSATDVTTGQAIAALGQIDLALVVEIGGSVRFVGAGNGALAANSVYGGACFVTVAAGTYDISVQFKSSSGSVTVKNRKLWVKALNF